MKIDKFSLFNPLRVSFTSQSYFEFVNIWFAVVFVGTSPRPLYASLDYRDVREYAFSYSISHKEDVFLVKQSFSLETEEHFEYGFIHSNFKHYGKLSR